MLSHKNWLINVAVRGSREGLLDRVAADAKLTRGRRLKISHPGVGYSQAEGLTLVAEEAVEIRVLRRQARARVISAIEEAALGSSRIAPFLKSAAAWSERLNVEQDDALPSLIDRVDLGQDGMRLSIKLPLSNTGAPDGTGHVSLKRHVPMQIRRRGTEGLAPLDPARRSACHQSEPCRQSTRQRCRSYPS